MIELVRQNRKILLKVYAGVALILAAVFSPPALSFIPAIVLAWLIIQWLWPFNPLIILMTQYFVFFAVSLLFSPSLGPYFPVLIGLPLLVTVDDAIREMPISFISDTHLKRRPTGILIVFGSVTLAVFLVSLMVGNITLILTSIFAIVYLATLILVVLRYFPQKPVEEDPIQLKVVAGKEEPGEFTLTVKTRMGSQLYIKSPYDWVKVNPGEASMEDKKLTFKIALQPSLSGPAEIQLTAFACDRWGLLQFRFMVNPIKLTVIPRARYAEWMARKYMAGTKQGTLPLISNIGAIKPLYGLRRGIEYYGNQLYQPGDSLKNIDWKHSYKYNEMISKEFSEFQGQSAILLINLVTGNEEEKDTLAYNILAAAISLAQESIPSALAVYDAEKVVLTTESLIPQRLVLRCLQVVKEIVIDAQPIKYLEPPNVMRLKTNIRRVQEIDSPPARALGELLQLEYKYLEHSAETSPATRAISEVQSRVTQQATFVVISQQNHDAEALAVNAQMLSRKGTAFIYI